MVTIKIHVSNLCEVSVEIHTSPVLPPTQSQEQAVEQAEEKANSDDNGEPLPPTSNK